MQRNKTKIQLANSMKIVSGLMKKEKKGKTVLDCLKYIKSERNAIKLNRQLRNKLKKM